MDQKHDNGRFVLPSLIIAALPAGLLSGRIVQHLGFEPTTGNTIIAGTIIGATLFVASLAIITFVAGSLKRKDG